MRHVESGGLASWLANIARFNLRDRIRVRGDEIGETMENHRTIIHGLRGPASVATTCKVNASLSEYPRVSVAAPELSQLSKTSLHTGCQRLIKSRSSVQRAACPAEQ